MAGKDNKNDADDIKVDLIAREVEEEVRREQLEKLWKDYGTYLILGAALIVVGVGGWQWWKGRAIAAAEAAGARFEDSLRLAEAGKTAEAEKAFQEIAAGRGGYASLSRLHVASAHAKAGRSVEAIAAFEAIGKDTAVDVLIRDLARLQAATLRIDQADWTEMQNRLNDLVHEKGAWRYSARELLGLAALKAGRIEDARKNFQELVADRKVPATIGQRAQIMMEHIVAQSLAAAGTSAPAPAGEKKP